MKSRLAFLGALFLVLFMAGSAMADQFRFVAKHRGDGRFGIVLCRGDGGRIVAILHPCTVSEDQSVPERHDASAIHRGDRSCLRQGFRETSEEGKTHSFE